MKSTRGIALPRRRRPRAIGGTTAADETPLIFAQLCATNGLARPEREHRFDVSRRWRFDYAWPDARVALEVEGGVWTGGRHTRGSGFLRDMEKYNAAAAQGWRVLRCTPDTLVSLGTVELLRRAMQISA